jgi:signal transduction histidine kinase/ActR/RegA family two-component response regulator
MRIRIFIALMVAAIMLPLVLASAFAVNQIRLEEKTASLASLHKTVDAVGLTVDKDIQSSIASMMALGNSEHLQTGNFEAFYAQAKAINQKKDTWVALYKSDGRQVFHTSMPFSAQPLESVSPAFAEKIKMAQKPFVSDIFVGPMTQRQLIAVYVPTSPFGTNQYVIAQAFSLDHWKDAAKQQDIPTDWIVAVVDRAGRFIARSHKSEEFVGRQARPELVAAAANKDVGLLRHSTTEGIDSYDAFNHSNLTGWTIAVAAPVTSVNAPLIRAVQSAVAGFLLAILVSGVLAAAFARRFIAAVQNASAAAVALGQGRAPKKTANTPITEVNILNQSLTNAGELLEKERLARQLAEAERERLLVVEHLAYEAIQKENTAKDHFLAMLGHELRNPIAAISGAVEVLAHGSKAAQNSNHHLDIIRRQNRHLVHIIDDLLDMSRLMVGKIVLHLRPLDLAECLHSSVDGLKAAQRTNNHSININAESVWINADPVRIEQIIVNLIGNALKFSAPASAINIDLKQDGGQAILSVHDQGPGMTPELLAELFKPFTQGPPPANGNQGGMGVGLALVKQLVELHSGTVTAASAGLNQGSTFLCHFPALLAPFSEPAPSAPLAAAVQQARQLLYVEDNADLRAVMSEMLRLSGYEVREAVNGEAALAAVSLNPPDAIVMDIGLPDMHGYELARQIRLLPNGRDVPIIALTGFGQSRDKEAAAQAGFNAHLVKPVDPEKLILTIETLLANTHY